MANGHGGKRPNSGPAKGTKYAPTISKEAGRELVRQVVLNHLEDMMAAQVAHAKGLTYLVRRDKGSGKFVRVTADMLDKQSEDDVIEMWTKEPNVPAFTDLLNRALDKPKEQEQEHKIDAEVTFRWQS
jgi:hypothetical protein